MILVPILEVKMATLISSATKKYIKYKQKISENFLFWFIVTLYDRNMKLEKKSILKKIFSMNFFSIV